MTVLDLIQRLVALPDYAMPMVGTITDDSGETVLSENLWDGGDGSPRLNFEYPEPL